jgi:hypothetical protein
MKGSRVGKLQMPNSKKAIQFTLIRKSKQSLRQKKKTRRDRWRKISIGLKEAMISQSSSL